MSAREPSNAFQHGKESIGDLTAAVRLTIRSLLQILCFQVPALRKAYG